MNAIGGVGNWLNNEIRHAYAGGGVSIVAIILIIFIILLLIMSLLVTLSCWTAA
jgi:hypothetical protein